MVLSRLSIRVDKRGWITKPNEGQNTMLTFLANYAASQNLPYEFVEWALDNYGHDAEDYPLTETLHRAWNDAQEAA